MRCGDKFCCFAKIISDHNATWSVVQGELRGHSDNVQSVGFSPDGKRIVSGSLDKTIRLWEAETGEPLRAPLKGHQRPVSSVANSVRELFSNKELLFWFEALSLLKSINTCAGSLSSLIQWIMVCQLVL